MISSFAMTSHASQRRRERGIPHHVLELLQQHGSAFRSRGADRLIFDKAALARLGQHLGFGLTLRTVEPWLNVYAVVGDDGTIITVARRTKRILRKSQHPWRRTRRRSRRRPAPKVRR